MLPQKSCMPPGPAYNWFCVLSSFADVLSHAAKIRASQVTPRTAVLHPRKRRRTEDVAFEPVEVSTNLNGAGAVSPGPVVTPLDTAGLNGVQRVPDQVAEVSAQQTLPNLLDEPVANPEPRVPDVPPVVAVEAPVIPPEVCLISFTHFLCSSPVLSKIPMLREAEPPPPSRNLQSSKVPSSRIGRLIHYGGGYSHKPVIYLFKLPQFQA